MCQSTPIYHSTLTKPNTSSSILTNLALNLQDEAVFFCFRPTLPSMPISYFFLFLQVLTPWVIFFFPLPSFSIFPTLLGSFSQSENMPFSPILRSRGLPNFKLVPLLSNQTSQNGWPHPHLCFTISYCLLSTLQSGFCQQCSTAICSLRLSVLHQLYFIQNHFGIFCCI